MACDEGEWTPHVSSTSNVRVDLPAPTSSDVLSWTLRYRIRHCQEQESNKVILGSTQNCWTTELNITTEIKGENVVMEETDVPIGVDWMFFCLVCLFVCPQIRVDVPLHFCTWQHYHRKMANALNSTGYFSRHCNSLWGKPIYFSHRMFPLEDEACILPRRNWWHGIIDSPKCHGYHENC